jgi:hypothetical protein
MVAVLFNTKSLNKVFLSSLVSNDSVVSDKKTNMPPYRQMSIGLFCKMYKNVFLRNFKN